ncbi:MULTISPECIES: aldehyde dehydrogenase family protein [unclassified Acidiplasma]|uniref:aldehyde dehydrogenase family protein n=1 Tax=unclassified Acidiplasma TaxID=2641301 RepID=UPI000A4BE3C1|nr:MULTISPECIES: aldehyde dehydrogenase family protein [unclassified Acidiplasma]WMT54814.1 MAG: aldehyde dehydrogenase family protein [Acidiplasma sp.]
MKTENMEYKVFNYVNGQRVENKGKTEYRVFNPAFGKQIASVFDTGAEDVNKAVDYAYDAFLKWSKIPITDRIKISF